MKVNFLKMIKQQLEYSILNKELLNITLEEKENLNKIINFTVSWLLKNIGFSNNPDNLDFTYDKVNIRPLSVDKIEKLDNFIDLLGYTILNQLLVYHKTVILKCVHNPEGILNKIIEDSHCEFLNLCLPLKTKLTILKNQVWLDTGFGNKLAFDSLKYNDFNQINLEKLEGNEFILPSDFVLSNYDFINKFSESSYKKYTL